MAFSDLEIEFWGFGFTVLGFGLELDKEDKFARFKNVANQLQAFQTWQGRVMTLRALAADSCILVVESTLLTALFHTPQERALSLARSAISDIGNPKVITGGGGLPQAALTCCKLSRWMLAAAMYSVLTKTCESHAAAQVVQVRVKQQAFEP